VFEEAGHYFLKYRAAELAAVLTGPVPTEADGPSSTPVGPSTAQVGPRPGMGRFLAVAVGQLVSMTGTALTEFALPIWAYLETDSLLRFALFAVAAVLPGILVAPFTGALVDRSDRRRVLIGASVLAGSIQAVLAVLLVSGALRSVLLYGLLAVLSVALTLQRLGYASAVPQLVPKHFLGHANGVVQFSTGAAQFLVPLVAVALLHAVGMIGILLIDVASYLVCVGVLLVVRFPNTLAGHRRETVLEEIRGGYRYFFRRRGLRAMLFFFVGFNAPLAAVVVLVSPLVLTMGTLGDAARVAMISATGAIAGGLLLALWGGPKRHRMRGLLLAAGGVAASAVLAGLRPSLTWLAVAMFGVSFAMVLVNGAWMTIIHTKVPQRFHARVIALNQMVALSVLSLGYLLAPLAGTALQPLLDPGGALAGTVGRLIGTGPGRGTGLLYVLCGLGIAVLVAVGLRVPALARFDDDVPDAEPDDLVGLAALEARRSGPAPTG
jgi:MFS family permease